MMIKGPMAYPFVGAYGSLATDASRLTEIAQRPLRRIAEHFVRGILLQANMLAKAGHESLTYAVPWLVIGLPLYDISKLVQAVQAQLRDRGFQVNAVGRVLEVSWHERKDDNAWGKSGSKSGSNSRSRKGLRL